ncbi:MAG: UDP-N-acetylglucosamine 2-epimerase (non-hydrolyzing) [Candidatus Omnitrophica bacterium]|nr:UDP-N-acetylglucosamine 2-epimerase (non-hydrolyzing) [Candidatus Omnitrophota bacterium]
MGTRPEVIKLAPVVAALRADKRLRVSVIATGQHRSMMDEALKVFGIKPEYDLDIMRSGQSLFDVTSRILQEIPKVLDKEKFDLMVVQGDTATTFACALAAYYCRIPVAHVEAGLRTSDKYRPFPEEVNRRLTGVLADIHFPPTDQARRDLLKEGVASDMVFMSGNTVVDALRMAGKGKIKFKNEILRKIDVQGRKIILVTLHRRESFGDGLDNILLALRDISMLPGVDVVYPVHMNPHVRRQVDRILKGGKVHLLEPLSYDQFVPLMQKAYLIVTDSGGIQEEACALKKPVIIAREKTERPEAVEAGFAELLGFDRVKIVASTKRLLEDKIYYCKRCSNKNPFGDGKASQRIALACLHFLQQNRKEG